MLFIGTGVLALAAIVSQFMARETTDLDLAQAAHLAHAPQGSKAWISANLRGLMWQWCDRITGIPPLRVTIGSHVKALNCAGHGM